MVRLPLPSESTQSTRVCHYAIHPADQSRGLSGRAAVNVKKSSEDSELFLFFLML
jgi:hypothetical protein